MKTEECITSIIIPAFNEEAQIATTLSKLKRFRPIKNTEIIVVDNGSSDDTLKIVESCDVTCLSLPTGNVSAVRNYGVHHSHGDVIIFIDADVYVTQQWQENLGDTIARLKKNPNQILGSRCLPTSEQSLLNYYWYSRLSQTKTNYINSGHMITSKALFKRVGGFDESLISGEDYDFCVRAKKTNAIIEEIPQLAVVHTGYPENISGFLKREIWHGTEDFLSLNSMLNSKTALISIFNLLSFVATILLAVVFGNLLLLLLYPAIISILCILLTLVKFGARDPLKLPGTTLVFFIYIWGRSLSPFSRLIRNRSTIKSDVNKL